MDVDDLTTQDVDQLSRLIADALQVVDQDQGRTRGLTRARTGPRDLEEELRDGEEERNNEEQEEKMLEAAATLKPQGSTSKMSAALQGNFTVIHFVFTQFKY